MLFTSLGETFTIDDVKANLKTLQTIMPTFMFTIIENLVATCTSDEQIQDVIYRRIKISGISDWTCFVAQLSLDPYADIFPTNDVWLQNKLAHLFQLEKRPSAKQVTALTDNWSPYRGYIAWHLWRDL
jgi:3-methyladenine DNA glycosylase/8-oxoguanine DNA glycosylase